MDGGRRWRKGERENEKGSRGSCEWEDGAGGVGWGNGERGEAAGAGRGLLLGLWGCGAAGTSAPCPDGHRAVSAGRTSKLKAGGERGGR